MLALATSLLAAAPILVSARHAPFGTRPHVARQAQTFGTCGAPTMIVRHRSSDRADLSVRPRPRRPLRDGVRADRQDAVQPRLGPEPRHHRPIPVRDRLYVRADRAAATRSSTPAASSAPTRPTRPRSKPATTPSPRCRPTRPRLARRPTRGTRRSASRPTSPRSPRSATMVRGPDWDLAEPVRSARRRRCGRCCGVRACCERRQRQRRQRQRERQRGCASMPRRSSD